MVQTARKSRTVYVAGPRRVQVVEEAVGSPGPRQVLIRTTHSGISAGTEMNVYRGLAPQWRRRQDPETGLFVETDNPDWSYPLAYGYQSTGIVEEVGPGVEGVEPGDRIFAFTRHAERSIVDAGLVFVLPELEDPEQGVFFSNLNTAMNGILDARIPFGADVVVMGLGVVGLLVTQLALRAGAGTVVGVDGVEHRRRVALEIGADEVLSSADCVAETIRERTANRGADIVFEVSGASPALNEAIRTVGRDGTVIAMSWYGGSFENLDLSGEFHHNRPRIRSSQVAHVNPDLGPLWSVGRRLEFALKILPELGLGRYVTHRFPVEEAAEAYRAVDEGREGLVQAVISYE